MSTSTLADRDSLELPKIDSVELRTIDSRELRMVEHLEAQLIARFSPPLHQNEVQRALIDCAASYESARVRSYLPVLIERDATRRLRDLSRSRPI